MVVWDIQIGYPKQFGLSVLYSTPEVRILIVYFWLLDEVNIWIKRTGYCYFTFQNDSLCIPEENEHEFSCRWLRAEILVSAMSYGVILHFLSISGWWYWTQVSSPVTILPKIFKKRISDRYSNVVYIDNGAASCYWYCCRLPCCNINLSSIDHFVKLKE